MSTRTYPVSNLCPVKIIALSIATYFPREQCLLPALAALTLKIEQDPFIQWFETSAVKPVKPNDLEFGLTFCCLSHLPHEKVYFISKNLLLKIQLKYTVESSSASQALCSASGCCAGTMHH